MKKRILFMWSSALTIMLVMLLQTSREVQNLEKDLKKIDYKTSVLKENLKVMKSEWSYLTAPDRIYKISKKKFPNLKSASSDDLLKRETLLKNLLEK